jgi:hypothetical protein
MSLSILSKKEKSEFKARLSLTGKTPLKPQLISVVKVVGSLNNAINIAGLMSQPLKALPSPTVTLTPISPASKDGQSYLRLSTTGGMGLSKDSTFAIWTSDPDDPLIKFSVPGTYLDLFFGTIPGSLYTVEIIVNNSTKPFPQAYWSVTNLEADSQTIFPPNSQSIAVAFKAINHTSHLSISYVLPEGGYGLVPCYDQPTFYSCTLRLVT